MAKRPGGVMVQGAEPTRSQLIPVLTKWEEIGKKAQLGPALFCIAVFFAMNIFGSTKTITIEMYGADGSPTNPMGWIYTSTYLIILGVFLTLASLYFIFRMVGKNKSWWVLMGAMAFTAYFIWLMSTRGYFGWLYDFFHTDLAGGEPDDNGPFLQLFMRHFLGTGFFEETVKAIPVLLLAYLAKYMSPTVRTKFAVEEPLDGILVGAAAGGGFAIMETLLQYVPSYLAQHWLIIGMALHGITGDAVKPFLANVTFDQLNDLIQLGSAVLHTDPGIGNLITRSLDLSFGHMAYSGYFGYFIGLSVLKPEQRWKILGIGLVSASIPHALWDSVASLDLPPLQAAVAVLSYAVLAAAILKAREISPNRQLLLPSVIFGAGEAAMIAAAGPVAAHRPAPAASASPILHAEPVASPAAPFSPRGELGGNAGNRLRVGTRYLVIVAGMRLLEHQVPGLQAQQSGGPVAEVTRNPSDPAVLGLTNLSMSAWEVLSGNGIRRQIVTGQTIKLAPGTRIDFGSTDGEVG
jgi:RsiW-degrading membrane proteinase PrsW (M82 family)